MNGTPSVRLGFTTQGVQIVTKDMRNCIRFTAPDSVAVWIQNFRRTQVFDHSIDAGENLRPEFQRREGPHRRAAHR
jgi:hypothetical protein